MAAHIPPGATDGSGQGFGAALGLGGGPPEAGPTLAATAQAAALLTHAGAPLEIQPTAGAPLFPGLAELTAPHQGPLAGAAPGTTGADAPSTAAGASPVTSSGFASGPQGLSGLQQALLLQEALPLDPTGAGAVPGPGPTDGGSAPEEGDTPEAIAAALAGRIAGAGGRVIFEKALTASDVGGSGRVVVPKSIAEQYFPRLEQPSGVTVSASDLDGRHYTFKWRFWVNNSSRMYLLEGAGELHRNYGLEVGDVMVFAQRPDGSLLVAGRVANKSDVVKKPPAKRSAAGGGGGAASARSRGAPPARAPHARQPAFSPGSGSEGGGAAFGSFASPAPGEGGGGGSAGEGGGGAYRRGRKRKASTPAGGIGGGGGGVGGVGDPRVRASAPEPLSLSVLDLEAPSDGVFRAVALQHVQPVALGVALARNNRWTATLDLAGEQYQAFFDSRDDALEALAAAGALV